MNAFVRIEKYKDTDKGTDLIISVPIKGLGEVLSKKKIKDAEIRLDDGRHISAEQRKKAYATIRDIASYTGYLPEEQKEWLKYLHIVKTGCGYFSLADCSMDTAREFINTITQTRISVEGRASKKCIKYMELSTRRMRKTNSRNKGASGERELARKLKEYGYEARRGQQYCGSNGDADVVGLPGIHIECKRVERLNLYDALAQSVADAKTDEKPTVFHRKNNCGWLVTMRFEDFMELYGDSR